MTAPPTDHPPKTVLRERFARYRAGLNASAYRRLSGRIVQRLAALPHVEEAHVIHVYWPMVERREVDVRPLIAALHARRKRIVLPAVRRFDRATGGAPCLEHHVFQGEAALCANKWGILEPSGGQTVPLQDIDLVIVPALGAGRNGHRVGHGFGHYDSFLRELSVPRIAPVYHECLVPFVPAEAHDVALTAIVTERELVYPATV